MAVRRAGPLPPLPTLEAFDAFRRSPANTVHNAWPELADSTDYSQPWSQPLIRTLWFPAVRPISHLPWSFAHHALFVHEGTHVIFDFSPAAECSRLLLGLAHNLVGDLFLDLPASEIESRLPRIGASLRHLNGLLANNFEQTTLSDELVATAASIEGVMRPVGSTRGLTTTEQESLVNAATLTYGLTVPGFAGNLDVFRKAARLAQDAGPPLSYMFFARLVVYLNPISATTPLPTVGDCAPRVAQFAAAAESGADLGQLLRWFHSEMESNDDVPAWRVALAAQVRHQEESDESAYLWSAARRPAARYKGPRAAQNIAEKLVSKYWNGGGVTDHEIVELSPERVDDQWYVRPLHTGRSDNLIPPLVLDSFRQQIATGRGFHCPWAVTFGTAGTCFCRSEPTLRGAMERISAWIVDGHLGDGDWTPLSGPCA